MSAESKSRSRFPRQQEGLLSHHCIQEGGGDSCYYGDEMLPLNRTVEKGTDVCGCGENPVIVAVSSNL